VQVLNEFVSTARGKLAMEWHDVRTVLNGLRINCDILPLTEETHVRGLALAERHKLHIYDGMIVAAAALAGCTTLYSEDMHDGLTIDGVTVRNPYKS
jgi:predicted nucleic acid-binding protein